MNDRTTAKIHIYKVDKESGKAAAQGDASLEGAVYGLYARNDIVHPDGATTITSDDKGHAVSIAIPYGTYVVVESKTPHNMKTTFEVKETAEIQKVSMKDEQAVGKIVI